MGQFDDMTSSVNGRKRLSGLWRRESVSRSIEVGLEDVFVNGDLGCVSGTWEHRRCGH